MKTFTPDLDPAVLERLREYATRFAPDFPQSKPALGRCVPPGVAPRRRAQEHRAHLPPRHPAARPDHQGSRAGAPTVRQPEPVGRPEGADPVPGPHGRTVRFARRRVRPRRHQLPQAGCAFRRGSAPVLRGAGQAGQLPGRGHPSLLRPAWALPAGRAPAPARELDRRRRADGRGGRARGVPGRQDQGPDRPGVDRPGAGRRDHRRHGGRRSGLRGCRGAGRAGRAWVAVRGRRAGHQRGVPEGARLGSPAAPAAVAGPRVAGFWIRGRCHPPRSKRSPRA